MNRPQLLLSTLQKRLLAAERCTASAKDLPTAADILYRNQGAIKNRLRLFHLFRLQSQLKLDRQMLECTQVLYLPHLSLCSDAQAMGD